MKLMSLKRMNSIICPTGKAQIDNDVSRLTVFGTVLLMGAFLYTRQPAYMIIATLDTVIRGSLVPKYSVISMILSRIFSIFNRRIKKKKVSLAKKQFAARLGSLCGVCSVLFFYSGINSAALGLAGFWMVLAILDSVFNLCMGCIIYTYVVFPFYAKD